MYAQDHLAAFDIGTPYHDAPVEPAGTQQRETEAAVATLEKAAPVLCTIPRRVDFERAIAVGFGPQEYPPAWRSADEVKPVWEFVKQRMTANG